MVLLSLQQAALALPFSSIPRYRSNSYAFSEAWMPYCLRCRSADMSTIDDSIRRPSSVSTNIPRGIFLNLASSLFGVALAPQSITATAKAASVETPTIKSASSLSPLQARLAAVKLAPLRQDFSPFAPNEVFYPDWLVGSWNVTATLVAKQYPFGTDVVPNPSLVTGSPKYRGEKTGEAVSYETRFIPKAAWNGKGNIANRSFNSMSAAKAYNQLVKPARIYWDPKVDPTRLTAYSQSGTGPDMLPLSARKIQAYYTARVTEDVASNMFLCAEKSRTVSLGTPSFISDQETITEFIRQDNGTVIANQRLAVFLVPEPNSIEGVLSQKVGGRAIALYDYALTMQPK